MGPGPLIAIDVVLIYMLFGPLVLLGIYVVFDSYMAGNNEIRSGKEDPLRDTDPALMDELDISIFMDQSQQIK